VLAQRLERLGQEAALAHDGAGAVVADQALGEAAHAGGRGRADAHRLVRAVRQLAHVRRGVQQGRAAQRERRLLALVEDPDLGGVADPDDLALDRDRVAGVERADSRLVGGEADLLVGHGHASLSYAIAPAAEMWALARRAAQHW
jgi:hypothetical protein